MTLGEYIKRKRKENGISVWILGELCDVSGSYISLIETGKISNNPSEELIKKIALQLKLNEQEKNILYELYADHILPAIIREKRKKELKLKKMDKFELLFSLFLDEGIDIDSFDNKQIKRLVSQAKLINEESD
ncbi:MAG: helix-turn-helix domain-containing protein [Fusobacteriaceae bacterium]